MLPHLTPRGEVAMGLFKELNHVSITVTDVAKAREFYTGLLGLQEIPRPAFDFPGIWYSLGNGLSLHIILNDQLVRPAVERETIQARYAHFALWTEDASPCAMWSPAPRDCARSSSRIPTATWSSSSAPPSPRRRGAWNRSPTYAFGVAG